MIKQEVLTKGDRAMLVAARMQVLLEKNSWLFLSADGHLRTGGSIPQNKVLQECYDIIKKAKIPKKYLLAETLDESTNKT